MANIKSQIKRNRQNEKRRATNRSVRSEVRTRSRAAIEATQQGSDDAAAATELAIKRIDKAAAKGTIHKRTAARSKSRLVKQLARIQAGNE